MSTAFTPVFSFNNLLSSRVQTGNKFHELFVLCAIFTFPNNIFILFRASPSGEINDALLVSAIVSMRIRWGDEFGVVQERREGRKQRGQVLLKAFNIVTFTTFCQVISTHLIGGKYSTYQVDIKDINSLHYRDMIWFWRAKKIWGTVKYRPGDWGRIHDVNVVSGARVRKHGFKSNSDKKFV